MIYFALSIQTRTYTIINVHVCQISPFNIDYSTTLKLCADTEVIDHLANHRLIMLIIYAPFVANACVTQVLSNESHVIFRLGR